MAYLRDFTVHLWDMPGSGQSSKEPGHDVDLGIQGEAFAALLTHWQPDAPHVIAHEYGGAVALRAHLLRAMPYAALVPRRRRHRRVAAVGIPLLHTGG